MKAKKKTPRVNAECSPAASPISAHEDLNGGDACFDRYHLADVAPVFNLILHGSMEGHFSNVYTQPRYMAGLGIQLFTVLFGKRIKLPQDDWYRMDTTILRIENEFAGFAMVRHGAHGPKCSELYMFAVAPEFRGRGLGQTMLRTVVSHLPIGHQMVADCLPKSTAMQGLLTKLGFSAHAAPPRKRRVNNEFRHFTFSY
jgi:GNAT superfamily N-acetyltransferase